MKRQFSDSEPELMDLPGLNEKELREDLKNLESLNRNFGAKAAITRVLNVFRDSGQRPSTLLDLCCGFGDHDRTLAQLAADQGQKMTILALDFQMETLKLAQEACGDHPAIVFIRADARKLPFAKRSVDAVTCSLALHHFSDTDARQVLAEMARVGKHGLACIDLVRSRFAAFCIWVVTAVVMTNRMTVHDARLSIRRAFSRDELSALAEEAGWKKPGTLLEHWRLGWFRQAVVRTPADERA